MNETLIFNPKMSRKPPPSYGDYELSRLLGNMDRRFSTNNGYGESGRRLFAWGT